MLFLCPWCSTETALAVASQRYVLSIPRWRRPVSRREAWYPLAPMLIFFAIMIIGASRG